ncbi:MAG: efflux RND transporter periplasmic adaptor subunit [Candidatus Cybelea sp.]
MIALVIAVAVVAAVAIRSVVAGPSRSASIEASGTIEAVESDVSPKVQGRLVDLRVRDGDRVSKGEVVAVLEQLDPGLNLAQARANVTAALAQVGVAQAAYDLQRDNYATTLAQAGEGVTIAHSRLGQAGENLDITTRAAALDVDQARAQLVAAESTYDKARIDLARAKSLVGTGDEPQQTLDDASAGYRSAAAQLQAAHDAVATAQANLQNVAVRQLDVIASREQHQQSLANLQYAEAERRLVTQRHAQLLAAQAALAQARAAYDLAADQVHETKILAPFNGFVISHNFEVGDLVTLGAAAMTIGDLEHPYVYVYVSETDLPRIKTGMHADVTIDGMPGHTFAGTITEISNTAEFTPENVQTKEERIEYLVFRVKIQLNDTTGMLRPGLPADAVIHV